MTIEQLSRLATFGSTWAALAVGHNIADHVFGQSDHQAANKGAPTAEDVAAGASPRRGWGACLAHVGQYHLVMAVLLALVRLFVPMPLSVTGASAEARALANHWRDLAVEQIGELRRHKNLTAHLDRLIHHLQPGPVRDRLLAWAGTGQYLP
ncbi:hypothetical protein ACFYRC_37935 [Streptomyces sp. NPDC005279]|uniref:hypothetical protein n=1 Tax=Streptomyces sp. NPDC005279 TaxID=3364712 RepID=UPI0036CDF6A3